jgi:hypothetical protein
MPRDPDRNAFKWYYEQYRTPMSVFYRRKARTRRRLRSFENPMGKKPKRVKREKVEVEEVTLENLDQMMAQMAAALGLEWEG